ncbi:MAG: 3'-5' exonuclease [Acidimicrobiales bacterium]
MAFLIPENLRSRSDVLPGVSRLARLLQDSLDDAATVWYEPLFDPDGDRPDVVVLVPDVGVLVLEVLEAKAGMIQGVRGDQLVVSGRSGVRLVGDPLSRAALFARALQDRVTGEARLAAGDRLPVTAAGVFAYLTRDEATMKGIGQAVDLDQCLLRDDVEQGLGDAEGFRRLVAGLLSTGLRDPLSDEAERLHRALIHPDTVIGSPQLPFAAISPDEELRVLDRKQEALAKGLGEGHRVVRGVAGSGKTLVLTYRARLLAQAFPQHKVLITCFNRSLAGALRRQLSTPNVTVQTIDSLLNGFRWRDGQEMVPFKDTTLDDRAQPALELLSSGRSNHPRYDHLLIDEAQDFPTSALRVALAHLRDGSDSLLVVADAAQNIYRNNFTWKAAGINASGRTRVLDVSYRNTKEILEYAHAFLLKGGDVLLDDGRGGGDETVVVPPKLSPRHGPLPMLLHGESPVQEVLSIASRCRKLLDGGTSPSAIAILYGSQWAGGFHWPGNLSRALSRQDVPYFWVTDPESRTNKDNVGADPTMVTLSTIHSAKGLEWKHVFLCGYLDDKPETDLILNRRLVYVGMTRASEELMLTASGNHPYIADLEA